MGNYEIWKDEYYKKEKVNLKEFFSESDINILKELDILILDKIYTENEFEQLYSQVLDFYDEEKEEFKNLFISKNISKKELDCILEKFENINEKYDF